MVYIISDEFQCKIGWSKNPTKRLKQLQTGSSKVLKIIKVYDVPRIKERYVHKQLWRQRIRVTNEWFDIQPEFAIEIVDALLNHAL